jgi:hypothetical protein
MVRPPDCIVRLAGRTVSGLSGTLNAARTEAFNGTPVALAMGPAISTPPAPPK